MSDRTFQLRQFRNKIAKFTEKYGPEEKIAVKSGILLDFMIQAVRLAESHEAILELKYPQIDNNKNRFTPGTILVDAEGVAWQKLPSGRWCTAKADRTTFEVPPNWYGPYKLIYNTGTEES